MTWIRKSGTNNRRFRSFTLYIRRDGPCTDIRFGVRLQDEAQRKEVK